MTALPQHMEELGNANRVRFQNSAVKREVAAGDLTVVQALGDERAARLRIVDLLVAQRRWGADRAVKLLVEVGIHEHRRVCDLTARQRQALADHFDPPAPEPEPIAPPLVGMEPERVDARVAAALLRAPATRVELELRMREMLLAFDDLDASLCRLLQRGAVVVNKADGYELFSVQNREAA
jgi:hypothetical protein